MQITFDDNKTLADFNMAVLKGYEKSLVPSISNKSTKVNGRIGAWDFGDELGTLTYTFPIICMTQDTIERERDLDSFFKYLLDDFGMPRIVKVVLSNEPHLFFNAKLTKSNAPNRFNSSADFSLSLYSSDPRRYSRFKNDEVVWGSRKIDFSYPYKLGNFGVHNNIEIKEKTNLTIEIDGYNIKPIININGSAKGLFLLNNGTQQVSVPDFSNSKIMIDCQRYVMKRNGVETFIDFDEFILKRGTNRITIGGKSLNLKLSIEYRDEY